MKKLLYLYIIICIGLIGCSESSQEKYPRYKGFPVEKEITAEVISLGETALFRYPSNLIIKENYALVLDLHNAENSLHLFSYPDWEYLVAFCPKGDGPEEMVYCENFHFASLDTIWALDGQKFKLFRYSFSPETNAVQVVEQIDLDRELIQILDLVVTPDYFITPDRRGESRYILSDKQGKIIEEGGCIPHEENQEADFAMGEAWRSFLGYHPGKNLLAAVTQLGEVLEIYNLNNGSHTVVYGPGGAPTYRTREDGSAAHTNMMGFWDVKITDHYIYTIFDGTTMEEIREFYQNGGTHRNQGGYYIQVYTHDGEPVKRYKLDHPVSCMDVHEEEGYFFAADLNENDPILKYFL